MTDIDKLLAIHAIQSLKSRYFEYIDTKNWDGFRSVFAADLIADMREGSGDYDESQITHGADAFVGALAPMLQPITTVHHGHTPNITIETADRARGIWAMEDKLWVPESSPLPFRFMHGYGHYHERYVKIDGAWLIQETRLVRLHVETR